MTVKSKLEEVERCLVAARKAAWTHTGSELWNEIDSTLQDCRDSLALADPGKAWLDEVKREVFKETWRNNAKYEQIAPESIAGFERVARQVVARRCASALNDYAGAARLTRDVEVEIFLHIDKYHAIAKGGGE